MKLSKRKVSNLKEEIESRIETLEDKKREIIREITILQSALSYLRLISKGIDLGRKSKKRRKRRNA